MTDDPAQSPDDGRTEFERFVELAGGLVKVTKKDLDKARAREAVEKANQS